MQGKHSARVGEVLRLKRVRVLKDRVDFILEPAGPPVLPLADSHRMSRRLLCWLPGLASHRCSTAEDHSFVEEMRHTELPHLFEHVVLEVMSATGSPPSVRGETRWRRGEGLFVVSIFDDDDVVCTAAAELALLLLERAFDDSEVGDVQARLSEVAAWRTAPNLHQAAIDPL